MIIRKLFRFEGAHAVRNCTSKRCSRSGHGHSYIVEVKLRNRRGTGLDNGQMVVDFGLLKNSIGVLVDSFDHAYSMWNKEKDDYQNFVKTFDRYVIMPVSPSAEMYSLMMFAMFEKVLEKTTFKNDENPILESVIVHETTTGYAEAFRDDYASLWIREGYDIKDIYFSDGIREEWKDQDMWYKLCHTKGPVFVNPEVELTH